MKTLISNKIYITNPSWAVSSYAYTELVVTNPTYDTLMRLGKQDQVARRHIPKDMYLFVDKGNELILPIGVLPAIWNMIKDYPWETDFNNHEPISCISDKITQPLYDYQEEAVQQLMNAKSGILIAGCGAGKTNTGVELIHRIGKKFLWLCHTKDLCAQSYKRFKQLYPNMQIEITGDGQVRFGRDGTIATIQTMEKLDPDLYRNEFDLVMCDEAHHVSGSPTLLKMFVKVIDKIKARYKFGLTATEDRNDSLTKSMYASLGCSMKDGFAPVWKIDRSKVKTLEAERIEVKLDTPSSYNYLESDGSFSYPKLIDYISDNPVRNGKIVELAKQCETEGRKTLILCNRISQCEEIHRRLEEVGSKAVLLIGKVTSKKRKEILESETDWNIIVGTISLAKEGLDVTKLDTLIWAGCIGNKSDTVQSAGRIERICEGKKQPIVYDLIDTNIPYLVNRGKKRATWLKRRY